MNTRGLLIIITLVSLALFSWYLRDRERTPAPVQQTIPRVDSGYYLLNARITASDEDGESAYQIIAGEATQAALDAPIEMRAVRVTYGESETSQWLISADEATLEQTNTVLTLAGSVEATWQRQGNSEGDDDTTLTLLTESLAFDAERNIVETDALVRFDVGMGRLTATGMRASLQNDVVEFRSNVRGQFTP
ncbi:MAG: LPS export ABC transporter periplasmic protein LptC [Pseudomonadota bacterium]